MDCWRAARPQHPQLVSMFREMAITGAALSVVNFYPGMETPAANLQAND